MRVKRVELINFRNHKNTTLDLSFKTAIVGSNGKGKTNILDAIFLTINTQERNNYPRNISFNESVARSTAVVSDSGAETKKEILFDQEGKTKRNSQTNKETLSVYFKPEDAQIIAGSPGKRRAFVDQAESYINPSHRKTLMDYQKVVKNKNTLLRTAPLERELEPWNEKIAELGESIFLNRVDVCRKIEKEARGYYKKMDEGEIQIKYISEIKGISPKEEIKSLIKKGAVEELRRKKAIVGVHTDDALIAVNRINLTKYGSHGQQRMASFVLRLSQANLLERRWSQKPIILLDDLKSELDQKHKDMVEELLAGENQIIVTSTEKCFDEKEFSYIEV